MAEFPVAKLLFTDTTKTPFKDYKRFFPKVFVTSCALLVEKRKIKYFCSPICRCVPNLWKNSPWNFILETFTKHYRQFSVLLCRALIMPVANEDLPTFQSAWAFASLFCARTHSVATPTLCMYISFQGFSKREFGLCVTYISFVINGNLLFQSLLFLPDVNSTMMIYKRSW